MLTRKTLMRLSRRIVALSAVAIALVMLVSIHPAFSRFSMTLPVEGEVQNGRETFSGRATVFFTGGGNLVLTTSKGVVCKGDFINASRRGGSGTVICEDGRSGSFDFVTAGFSGFGTGLIDTEPFVFRIGE